MTKCGKLMGTGALGYHMICGKLWMGKISQCEDCRIKDVFEECIKDSFRYKKSKKGKLR